MAWDNVGGQIFQVTFCFRYFSQGWEEKLFIPAVDFAAAQTTAATLLAYRRKCLPALMEVIYVLINQKGGPRDGESVDISFPIPGQYTGGDTLADSVNPHKNPNSIEDCVAFRMESGEGQQSTHWLHGVPDAEVLQDDLVNTIGVSDSVPPAIDSVDANGDWNLTVQAYFSAIKANAVMYREVPLTTGLSKQKHTIRVVKSRGLSNRRCGPPFAIKRGRGPVR